MNRSIAFFDFDGTITRRETLFYFLKYSKGFWKFYLGMLIVFPVLVAFFLGLITDEKAKATILSFFLRGYNEDKLKGLADAFYQEKLKFILRQDALERILWHQQQGHQVCVVSASPELWIAPFCNSYKLDLIATKLSYKDGIFTGKFASKNCIRIEKANRIKDTFVLEDYREIYVYGDTEGDHAMLALATHPYYRFFNS